jgi:hypothetical protein
MKLAKGFSLHGLHNFPFAFFLNFAVQLPASERKPPGVFGIRFPASEEKSSGAFGITGCVEA